jgi:RHS repeat-associated protein
VVAANNSTFTYDNVGNMLTEKNSSTNAVIRAASYNSFRKPVSITKGTHTTSFDYGPDRSHYKRVDNTGVNVTKTLTVGNVEFIKVDSGPVKTKRYIGGVMVVTDFNGTHEEHALLTDHLGSTVVMAKANSTEMNQEDYDAFGKRRNLWTVEEELAADKLTLNKLTTTGFTGHEMLDEVGLIHMQGRVYDPNLGRFLSADPFITELDNTQNMNRYSYVYNNPLTLTDPSGFGVQDLDVTSGFGVVSYSCPYDQKGCFAGVSFGPSNNGGSSCDWECATADTTCHICGDYDPTNVEVNIRQDLDNETTKTPTFSEVMAGINRDDFGPSDEGTGNPFQRSDSDVSLVQVGKIALLHPFQKEIDTLITDYQGKLVGERGDYGVMSTAEKLSASGIYEITKKYGVEVAATISSDGAILDIYTDYDPLGVTVRWPANIGDTDGLSFWHTHREGRDLFSEGLDGDITIADDFGGWIFLDYGEGVIRAYNGGAFDSFKADARFENGKWTGYPASTCSGGFSCQ